MAVRAMGHLLPMCPLPVARRLLPLSWASWVLDEARGRRAVAHPGLFESSLLVPAGLVRRAPLLDLTWAHICACKIVNIDHAYARYAGGTVWHTNPYWAAVCTFLMV